VLHLRWDTLYIVVTELFGIREGQSNRTEVCWESRSLQGTRPLEMPGVQLQLPQSWIGFELGTKISTFELPSQKRYCLLKSLNWGTQTFLPKVNPTRRSFRNFSAPWRRVVTMVWYRMTVQSSRPRIALMQKVFCDPVKHIPRSVRGQLRKTEP
jgi:hypothetical protein